MRLFILLWQIKREVFFSGWVAEHNHISGLSRSVQAIIILTISPADAGLDISLSRS